jgi:hypothetical protein
VVELRGLASSVGSGVKAVEDERVGWLELRGLELPVGQGVKVVEAEAPWGSGWWS